MRKTLNENMWKGVPISELDIDGLREALDFLLQDTFRTVEHFRAADDKRVAELEKENAKLWKALGVGD